MLAKYLIFVLGELKDHSSYISLMISSQKHGYMPIGVCVAGWRLGDSLPLWAQSSNTPRTCILIFKVIYGSEFNTILMFSATFSSPAVVEVQLPVCPDTQQRSDKSGLLPSYKLFCQQVTTISVLAPMKIRKVYQLSAQVQAAHWEDDHPPWAGTSAAVVH